MIYFEAKRSLILSSKRLIHTAKVNEILPHTELIKEFIFDNETPKEFVFRAGQFLMIHVPNPEGGKNSLRAYSLASGEQNNNSFRLLIKYIPNGIASEYFWKLNPGEAVRFTGPFGKLFFPETPAKRLFFLSTGSGLAPHLSYIESHIERYPQSHFEFLVGVRTQNDFFFTGYLDNIKNKYPNFHYQFVLSRPDESWKGRCGYLQHQVMNLGAAPQDCQFFICGNEDMAKSTKQCLLDFGLTAEQVFVEIF